MSAEMGSNEVVADKTVPGADVVSGHVFAEGGTHDFCNGWASMLASRRGAANGQNSSEVSRSWLVTRSQTAKTIQSCRILGL